MAPDLERLARTPWPIASLASSGISPLSSTFALSCSRKAERVERNTPANSAQELEAPISTIRTASMRGRGGSTPKRRGGSPLSTQRQNFFSAVSRRCWYRQSAGMVISTHLPPPVMIESTAELGVGDPHVVLQLGHVLFRRPFFGERPGQHEFRLKNRPSGLDHAVQGRGHPTHHRMLHAALDPRQSLAGIAFVPKAIEGLGGEAELDDEVAGEVLRLYLAPFLAPQAE